jgi:hypothetical protein
LLQYASYNATIQGGQQGLVIDPDGWQHDENMEAEVGTFPERPGEPDCTYYMKTKLCGFGISCWFSMNKI